MRLRESILYLVLKARILETPCSPEIASERGWDRVCSGITRGEIMVWFERFGYFCYQYLSAS